MAAALFVSAPNPQLSVVGHAAQPEFLRQRMIRKYTQKPSPRQTRYPDQRTAAAGVRPTATLGGHGVTHGVANGTKRTMHLAWRKKSIPPAPKLRGGRPPTVRSQDLHQGEPQPPRQRHLHNSSRARCTGKKDSNIASTVLQSNAVVGR